MSISAADVKALREKTGVGMMACKKALAQANGDIDAAVKHLREKGLAAATKKAERSTNEGSIVTLVSDDQTKSIILELNCETDFVSGNDQFKALGSEIAAAALAAGVDSVEGLSGLTIDGKDFKQYLSDAVLRLGENLSVKRLELILAPSLVNYVHMGGKIGVLVGFSQDAGEVAQDVAMHAAAAAPSYLTADDVPSTDLDSEREILKKQVLAEGKPEAIVDKIVDGKIGKFYKENCLVEQSFVKDPSQQIKDVLPEGVSISLFRRYSMV